VLQLEVLVRELLAVDGLAARALIIAKSSACAVHISCSIPVLMTYVATSEVTTLEHEVRDHTVELAARVAEALLAGAEGTEVLGGLRDDIVVEGEVDTAPVLCCQVSAVFPSTSSLAMKLTSLVGTI